MKQDNWNWKHIVVVLLIALVFTIITCEAGAKQTIGQPLPKADNALSVIFSSSVEAQLQRENTLAVIETSMKVGANCALIAVSKHSMKHKKPITLRELRKKAKICIRMNMIELEYQQ